MYEVKTEIDFCYGHRLMKHQGHCMNIHGHNGKIVVTLKSKKLNDNNMVVDFGTIKANVRTWINTHLDHSMVYNENDVLIKSMMTKTGFRNFVTKEDPTAEVLAKEVYDKVKELVSSNGVILDSVTFYETPTSCATYYGGIKE